MKILLRALVTAAIFPLGALGPDTAAANDDPDASFEGGQRGGGKGGPGGKGRRGGGPGDSEHPGDDSRNRENSFTFNATRIYARAMQFKAYERCAEAVPLFRCLAKRGRGYELAQYHLGQCLLTLRRTSTDEAGKADHWTKATAWTRLAADAGLAEAQGALALMLVDSQNTETDPTQAGTRYR